MRVPPINSNDYGFIINEWVTRFVIVMLMIC